MSTFDRLYVMDTYSASAMARTIAQEAGLRFEFHDDPDNDSAFTNPITKTLHVQRPKWQWTEGQFMSWFGKVLHEIGHWRGEFRGDMLYFTEKGVDCTNTLYGRLINILMDFRQNQQWRFEYEGADEAIEHMCVTSADQGIVHASKDKDKMDERTTLLAHVFSWIYGCYSVFHKRMIPASMAWDNHFPQSKLARYTDELFAMSCPEDIETLAKKILNENEQEQEVKDQEEREKQHKEGKEKGEKEGEGKGKGELTEAQKKILEKMMPDAHDPDKRGKPSGQHELIDKPGDYIPHKEHKVFILAKGEKPR